ncbi:MAG TPA: sugar ABC transporter permease [Chloroflexi bacterium]|nr:sugar ABC transporter permease [Chloroflexota bacterium]HHW85424.1 sugar ABC transporter permease [Chloroflexota bacterium]
MRQKTIFPYLLILPALLIICLVSLYPALYSIFLSVNTFRRGERVFVGTRNFEQILASANFWDSLRLTAIYGVLFVLLTMIFAFILAVMLNRRLNYTGLFMTMIFVPWILSEVVTGVIFRWLFLPGYGLLQDLLSPLFGDIAFLGHPQGAMGVVIGATIWRTLAFAMLLILAGLQTIPGEVYEAGAIDGANGWQSFWSITWPLVRPTTLVIVLLLTLQAINATGLFLSITNGGPGRATEVLSVSMYREAIVFFNFGYGAALAVLMLLINIVLAAIYIRTMRSEVVA